MKPLAEATSFERLLEVLVSAYLTLVKAGGLQPMLTGKAVAPA